MQHTVHPSQVGWLWGGVKAGSGVSARSGCWSGCAFCLSCCLCRWQRVSPGGMGWSLAGPCPLLLNPAGSRHRGTEGKGGGSLCPSAGVEGGGIPGVENVHLWGAPWCGAEGSPAEGCPQPSQALTCRDASWVSQVPRRGWRFCPRVLAQAWPAPPPTAAAPRSPPEQSHSVTLALLWVPEASWHPVPWGSRVGCCDTGVHRVLVHG